MGRWKRGRLTADVTPFTLPPQGHADMAVSEMENFQCLVLGFQFIVHIPPFRFWDNLIKKKTDLVL